MKVVTIAAFYDAQKMVLRSVGDEFEATPERVAQLNACGPEQNHIPLVKELRRKGRPSKASEDQEG